MSEIEKRDSDSQGEHEKTIGSHDENGHGRQTLYTLPDPDAGLSDEERAKVVS